MIPIHLNPEQVRIGLIGNGTLALRRYEWLVSQNCVPEVWSPDGEAAFVDRVGAAMRATLPDADALKGLSVLWIADLPPEQGHPLAQRARDLGILVNVEDDLPFCDFHTPAIVQRGALKVSIGTGGASPAAAGFIKRLIEAALPPVWDTILAQLAQLRTTMRGQGAGPKDVIAAAQSYLKEDDVARQIAPCAQETCPLLLHANKQRPSN
jgi:precorrin-2 dehydrogenase / sirohydrochlorin ferrochelatase